jgi:2-oxoglutarate ferredoxin oxidoreductase subunit delta
MVKKQKKAKGRKITRFQVKIEEDRCKGCGLCIAYCPVKHLAFSKDFNKKGRKYARVKGGNQCIGCGACFLICPDVAIKIYQKKENEKK